MAVFIQGLYFLTVTCNTWKRLIDKEEHRMIIVDSLTHFSKSGTCSFYGFVIMPNHLHLILGVRDEDLVRFQQGFLKFTAQQIIRNMKKENDPLLRQIRSTQKDRKYHFWERRPMWKGIPTPDIFWEKLKYIHNNPLQQHWQLSKTPEAYTYSSARSYLTGNSQFGFLTLWD